MARRGLRRHRNKRQVKIVMVSAIALLFIMTVGYAAFSTNVSLNAKGNLVKYGRTLATTYINNLRTNGDTTLIDDGTTDHNIRYSGKNVNNYVCLENENPCQDDNLYRIIGVFNNIKLSAESQTGETRVKLIKATSIGNNYWNNSTNNNNWTEASLKTTINALPIASNTLIDNTVWNLGVSDTSIVTTSTMYGYERGTTVYSENPTTWTGKVALMYPSDYGYASSSCYSTKNLGGGSPDYRDSDCTGSNWLFLGSNEWTLSTWSSFSDRAFIARSSGIVGSGVVGSNLYAVRPAVYLKSNVNIIENGNDGSENKPYFLELSETN